MFQADPLAAGGASTWGGPASAGAGGFGAAPMAAGQAAGAGGGDYEVVEIVDDKIDNVGGRPDVDGLAAGRASQTVRHCFATSSHVKSHSAVLDFRLERLRML